MTFSKSEPIKACSICGNVPSATVQVGGSIPLGWLECHPCNKRTRDGQTFEQARREWNRELA